MTVEFDIIVEKQDSNGETFKKLGIDKKPSYEVKKLSLKTQNVIAFYKSSTDVFDNIVETTIVDLAQGDTFMILYKYDNFKKIFEYVQETKVLTKEQALKECTTK